MNHLDKNLNRRFFLKAGIPAAAALFLPGLSNNLFSRQVYASKLKTRGVVLTVDDLLTLDWPRLAHDASLTTIGTHITPSQVSAYIETDKGKRFIEDCRKYNIHIEHELHAMNDLLPRNLFDKNPEMFRMNKEGSRVADYNCCPSSNEALNIISENAVKYSKLLRSTTERYFYWIDDAVPMCSCSKCADLSDSDQALLIENAIVKALRKEIPGATLAHLAYVNTMEPPKNIKPEAGIFLEFAPIYRSWNKPLSDKKAGAAAPKQGNGGFLTHGETLELLRANLAIFPVSTAQVLEYWLDVSLQSKWKKPAQQVDWYPDVCRNDINLYANEGIRNITTFAVYIDGTYRETYKDLSFINEYGKILNNYTVKQ